MERVAPGAPAVPAARRVEMVVATRADPAAPPEGADLGVDVETGAGVEELRRRVISELTA